MLTVTCTDQRLKCSITLIAIWNGLTCALLATISIRLRNTMQDLFELSITNNTHPMPQRHNHDDDDDTVTWWIAIDLGNNPHFRDALMPQRPVSLKPTPLRGRATASLPRSSNQHGYDYDWQQLRKQFLIEHPLCECDQCAAGRLRVTMANVVNHIEDIRDRPDLRLEWSNLQAMNKRCHDRHTRLRMNAAAGRMPTHGRAGRK
jgi:5-methylcytosine-specific restriction protein A